MSLALPLLLGLAHGVSDACAGLLIGLVIQQNSPEMNTLILFYNLLAFGLQPVAGMALDRMRQPKLGASFGLGLTLMGMLNLQANINIAILLIGLGSACLHAGGGSLAITSTPGKASAPGVFAGFGVVGLALGGIASINFSFIVVAGLAVLLAGLAIMIQVMPHNPVLLVEGKVAPLPVSEIMLILLVLAIALRSTVWVGTQMDVPRYSSAALWVALAAGMGKLVGGFGADQLGWKRWMLASMTGAFFFLVFARNWLPGQMLGAFLLQTMTPLSMAAVGKALPNSSGLAASLALGAAVIAGGLPFFILPPDWFGPFTMMIFLLASGLLYWVFIRQPQLDTMK